MPGVEIKESDVTLGCNGVQQCEVTFNNVELEKGKSLLRVTTSRNAGFITFQYPHCPNITQMALEDLQLVF